MLVLFAVVVIDVTSLATVGVVTLLGVAVVASANMSGDKYS